MAVVEETFFGIICDNCEEVCPSHNYIEAFYPDKNGALDNAVNSQLWHKTDDDKHYCPECYHFDDNDVLIIGHAEKVAYDKSKFDES